MKQACPSTIIDSPTAFNEDPLPNSLLSPSSRALSPSALRLLEEHSPKQVAPSMWFFLFCACMCFLFCLCVCACIHYFVCGVYVFLLLSVRVRMYSLFCVWRVCVSYFVCACAHVFIILCVACMCFLFCLCVCACIHYFVCGVYVFLILSGRVRMYSLF